jgi:hypothetical protein
MPKRVIDFDALWASDKLASCAEWAQSEYAWLYGLADASGSFEMTNLRVIWGRVAAVRKNLSLERLGEIFDEFIARGLLFTWEHNGKRYGHWTGSDVPGRLPPPSWRMRLEKLAPPVPRQALAAYSARFGGSREGVVFGADARSAATGSAVAPALPNALDSVPVVSTTAQNASAHGLKAEVEETQAQDWDLNLDWEKEVSLPQQTQERRLPWAPVTPPHSMQEPCNPAPQASSAETAPEKLLAIYEAERGALPPAHTLTAERRAKCAQWLAAGLTAGDFRAAVRRASATPFLAGAGERGWRASFDWLIADPGNARKVLEGEYAPSQQFSHARTQRPVARSRGERHGLADLYAGTGPRPADCGVRVNPAALERIRAREARLALGAAGAHAVAAESESPHAASVPQAAPVEAPRSAPQRVACMAQARASPAFLKS